MVFNQGSSPVSRIQVHDEVSVEANLEGSSKILDPLTVNGNTVDTVNRDPELDQPGDAAATDYIIVRHRQKLTSENTAQLETAKVQILGKLDGTSLLCRYKSYNLAIVEELAFVEQALVYLNRFKISAHIKELTSKLAAYDMLTCAVILHDGDPVTSEVLWDKLKNVIKAELLQDADNELCLNTNRKGIDRIALEDCVHTIEMTGIIQPLTMAASAILGVHDGIEQSAEYTGKGEIITISDRGFDIGDEHDVHPAFLDEDGNSRVEKIIPIGDPTTLADEEGHGTHVAGCALGYLDDTKGKVDSRNLQKISGPARQARLFFQVLPKIVNHASYRRIFWNNVNIHCCSWGQAYKYHSYMQRWYAYEASEIDRAMLDNRELLIVWAAGNEGSILTVSNGLYDSYGNLTGEANAKNSLVVGSTYSNRPLSDHNNTVCLDGLYAARPDFQHMKADQRVNFNTCDPNSSKGPTSEGRLKPDVVAPGVGILSAMSRGLQDPKMVNGTFGLSPNANFCFSSGTSMAAPLVAGCAAVLREALKKNGHLHPSGALVKALLINGANDLSQFKYMYMNLNQEWVQRDMPRAPNPIQGYGRVNLQRSLSSITNQGPGVGRALDIKDLKVDEPQQWDVQVPQERRVCRVTLTWTDPPGPSMLDDIRLSVDAFDFQDDFVSRRYPDKPQDPRYNKCIPPDGTYTTSNVQKVTWNLDEMKKRPVKRVLIKVVAKKLDKDRDAGAAALCWLLSDEVW